MFIVSLKSNLNPQTLPRLNKNTINEYIYIIIITFNLWASRCIKIDSLKNTIFLKL
jgi:hypothetical protein